MFKKAEDIKPLPAGMVDAFTAKISAQGYKMPEVEAVAEEPTVEVEAQPEEVSEATGSRGADKTGPGDGDTKMPKVADVTPEIGMISSKDKAAKSVETAVKAASKSQHEEFELVQDGGKLELEDVMYEATITVKSFTGKAPAGIKMKKIGSSSFGGDDVEMTGPDAKLIAYAKRSLGCDASCKTIADVQKSLEESYVDEKSCVGEMKKLHASSCSKHEMYKRVSEKYGCSEAKFEELYAQYCSENYEEVQEDNSNDKSDDGEGMDKVQPKAVKKKFGDRKDKDIDNDGDEDESDEYLHKRRKAISKALESKKPNASVDESAELDEAEDLQELSIGTLSKYVQKKVGKNARASESLKAMYALSKVPAFNKLNKADKDAAMKAIKDQEAMVKKSEKGINLAKLKATAKADKLGIDIVFGKDGKSMSRSKISMDEDFREKAISKALED